MVASPLSIEVETDHLLIKLKQLKAIQQAAHDLIQQESECQAVSTYVAVSGQILEIELELAARQADFSADDF